MATDIVRLSDWIASRTPVAPSALRERLSAIVGDDECHPDQLPSHLVQHAEGILKRIGDDRSHATDLLAADALISYAIEAVADACRDPAGFATEAMQRIAGTLSASDD